MTDTTTNTTANSENTEEKELEQAQKTGTVDFSQKKDEKDKSGNYTHTFKNPVKIEGKEYKTITFYFENLTGEDIEAVEEELQDQNKYVLSPEISSAFQSALAARAAKIPADDIRRFPVKDYMAIKNKARNFLINMG